MGKKGFFASFLDMLAKVPPVVTADLTGQTVAVDNLGLEGLRTETGFENVELRLVDLSKFSSVISFADSFKDEPRLDILVMNAAVGRFERKVTEDGWEEGKVQPDRTFAPRIQVNNLSTSLLTLLLVPKMEETAKLSGGNPRIVIVSSDVHFWAKLDDAVLNAESSFRALSDDPKKMTSRYLDTKLLNVFFTRSLSTLLSRSPLIVTTVNPGYCKSELRRHLSGILALLDRLMEFLLARTSEEGARELVWAAIGETREGEGSVKEKMNGAYVSTAKVIEPADFVLGEEGKKREDKLWADLIRELSKVDGRVVDIVKQRSS
ncbi:hypothetical protein NMY22_g9467 [Coprinellus aureogranulatus]|nr:hypothetical protein NMY22_g9467 [Coprinellus aureogranulatus]